MKADPQLLVSDVLHNKRGAGIVKARQETLWLQTRRHSSGPGPGEQNSLCFVAVITMAARIKLESTWEDATLFSREWEGKESGCREMLFLCNLWSLLGSSQVSVSGYGIPSNLCCGRASSAARFSIVLSLKSGFSLAAGPLWLSINILYYLFVKMNIAIIVGALGAYFSTWKMVLYSTAAVPDMFVFVMWFSPRAIRGASITNMKWDLRLKNLDNMVTLGHSDTVIFPWEVSLVKERKWKI